MTHPKHPPTLLVLYVLFTAMLLAVMLLSCTKEKVPSGVPVATIHQIALELVNSVEHKTAGRGLPVVDPYQTYANKIYSTFNAYRLQNSYTYQQAAKQWDVALRASPYQLTSPCTGLAWGKFWDKQPVCLGLTLVPFIGEVASISCLIGAGMTLTAELEICRTTPSPTNTK